MAAMAAVALLKDNEARDYFRKFDLVNHAHGRGYLHVEHLEVNLQITLEWILEKMIEYEDYQYFVIWTHGTWDGLLIPLCKEHVDPNSDLSPLVPARNHVLITLMQIDEVKKDRAKIENEIKKAIKGQNPLTLYQPLLTKIGVPETPPSLDEARSKVQSWIDFRLKSPLQLKERRLDEFLQKLGKVRQKKLQIVEIRSCFLGNHRFSLQVLRKLLGAEVVGAPNELSCFGPMHLESVGEGALDDYLQEHSGSHLRVYGKGEGLLNGSVALRYEKVSEVKANLFAAATSQAAIDEWIAKYLLSPGGGSQMMGMPMHMLLTPQPAVQGDGDWDFWSHMRYACLGDSDDLPDSSFIRVPQP